MSTRPESAVPAAGGPEPGAAGEALCKGSDDWFLDCGDLSQWLRSMSSCHDCPRLQACREELDAAYPQWWRWTWRDLGTRRGHIPLEATPRGVIWAGWAFAESGAVLTERGLRRAASELRARRVAETHRAAS